MPRRRVSAAEVVERAFVEYDESAVQDFRESLYQTIPREFFQERFGKRTPNVIKVLLVRETVGYLINRSTEPDEVVSTEVGDREVVVIPSRKLKSREKLTGLLLCRKLGVVDPAVEYNMIKERVQLANPNSLTFGDSITEEGGEAVGLPARVIYEWSYSLRDKAEITEELTHNALSEEGTMWDKERGEHRETLFDVQYVKPEAFFPQFVTFPDVTPEAFAHVMLSILKTTRYGAQSNVMDANVRNHVVAVALDQFEPPISSYLLTKEWGGGEVSLETVVDYCVGKLKGCSQRVLEGEQVEKLTETLLNLLKEEEKLKQLYLRLLDDSIRYLVECKVVKEGNIGEYLERLSL